MSTLPLADALTMAHGPARAAEMMRQFFLTAPPNGYNSAPADLCTAEMLATVAAQVADLEQIAAMRPVKTRSIPNVSTTRLIASARAIHGSIHEPDGIHAWTESRRSMADLGLKLVRIHQELVRRGITWTCCPVTARALPAWGAP